MRYALFKPPVGVQVTMEWEWFSGFSYFFCSLLDAGLTQRELIEWIKEFINEQIHIHVWTIKKVLDYHLSCIRSSLGIQILWDITVSITTNALLKAPFLKDVSNHFFILLVILHAVEYSSLYSLLANMSPKKKSKTVEGGQYKTSCDHSLIDLQQTSPNILQGNVKRCMWDAKTIVQRNSGNPSNGKWPKRGLSDGRLAERGF